MKKTPILGQNIVEAPLNGEVRDTVYDNVQLPGIFMDIAFHKVVQKIIMLFTCF